MGLVMTNLHHAIKAPVHLGEAEEQPVQVDRLLLRRSSAAGPGHTATVYGALVRNSMG